MCPRWQRREAITRLALAILVCLSFTVKGSHKFIFSSINGQVSVRYYTLVNSVSVPMKGYAAPFVRAAGWPALPAVVGPSTERARRRPGLGAVRPLIERPYGSTPDVSNVSYTRRCHRLDRAA
jgi:hypothetical protein